MERLFLYINLIEKRNSNDITFFYPSLFTDWSHAGDVSALCASETLLQAPENCFEWFSTGVRPVFLSCDDWPRKEDLPGLSTSAQLAQPRAVTVRGSLSALTFLWLQGFISVTAGLLHSVHSETVFFSGGNFIVQGKIFFNLSKDVIKSA